MVSDRQRRILDALIGEYVYTAEPVGSNTLVRRYNLGVSPATVRNELASLEDGGYVTSPHVSAGRIPTDAGYRTFVDFLLARPGSEAELEQRAQAMITEARKADELEELIAGVSAALTRLTHCLAVVAAPTVVRAKPQRISIVPVGGGMCVIVAVMQDGTVLNRRATLPYDVDPADMAFLETRLNEVLNGRESRKALELAETDPERLAALIGTDPLSSRMIAEVSACIESQQHDRPRHYGLSALLAQPEFKNGASAAAIAQLLEEEDGLGGLLDGMAELEGVVVRIGHENGIADPPVSVVATTYSADDAEGLVALIGPTRMDYRLAIGAVRAAAVTLESTL